MAKKTLVMGRVVWMCRFGMVRCVRREEWPWQDRAIVFYKIVCGREGWLVGGQKSGEGGKGRTYAFEVIKEPRTYTCELYFI